MGQIALDELAPKIFGRFDVLRGCSLARIELTQWQSGAVWGTPGIRFQIGPLVKVNLELVLAIFYSLQQPKYSRYAMYYVTGHERLLETCRHLPSFEYTLQ